MEFEKALRSELITISGLSAKVFPVNAPEGTSAPYVTYESSDHAEDKTFTGYLTTGSLDCTIDVLGKTYSEMKSVSKLVKDKIKSVQGRDIGVFVQNVTLDTSMPEMYEPNVDMYRKTIGFTVYF